MKARDFNTRFDSGEEVIRFLKLTGARRPGQSVRRVNVLPPVDDRFSGQRGSSPSVVSHKFVSHK
jgi:hypothetical protein